MTGPRADAEPATLEGLFRDHRVPLLRLAWLLTGNRPDAEDVVQGVFLRYSQLGGVPANPKAYLRAMVVNAARDLHRRRSRFGADPTVADVTCDAPEGQEVWEALRTLPEDQREVLVLRYHDDLPQEEIARVLGVPVGTVRSRVSRGLSRLREVCHE